jgi:hypothetical protein
MAEVGFTDSGIEIDAEFLAKGLGLSVAEMRDLMRAGAITSRSERGIGGDAGLYRLTFFHAGRRLRLIVDSEGRVIRRNAIDFGDRPLPAALRRP